MKKNLLITIIVLLFVGCKSNVGKPCFVKEIPAYQKEAAANYVKSLMATIQVQTRNDDEDWDDFIVAAHKSALDIYSETIKGVLVETQKEYLECDCSKIYTKALNLAVPPIPQTTSRPSTGEE